MAARGIKLHRYEIENANHYAIHGFRVHIEVDEVNGDVPREIFVYRRHPLNPDTGETLDEFLSVASFVDVSEYPVDNPDPEKNLSFFRKRVLEVDVRSKHDADLLWQTIVSEANALLGALEAADHLVSAEELWLGIQPQTSDSDSSSASTSV